MSKKTLDVKTARKFIIDGRNSGKTDQEIYHELSKTFYDKKTIVSLITGTVTVEKKNKYKMYNNILLGFIVIFVIFKILSTFFLIEQTREIWIILLPLIILFLCAGYFMYEIARYYGPIYRVCGIITFVTLFPSIRNTIDAGSDVEWIVNVILSIAIVFLSFYLEKKMFPNYRLRNLKKDDDGEYILDENCC